MTRDGIEVTYGQSVDHGLEAHIDFAATDDLGHIGGIVGLEKSHLQTLIGEVALGLGQIQRGMVRGSVPELFSMSIFDRQSKQAISLPVGQKGDLVSRHTGS